jgi:hypothetical protein
MNDLVMTDGEEHLELNLIDRSVYFQTLSDQGHHDDYPIYVAHNVTDLNRIILWLQAARSLMEPQNG